MTNHTKPSQQVPVAMIDKALADATDYKDLRDRLIALLAQSAPDAGLAEDAIQIADAERLRLAEMYQDRVNSGTSQMGGNMDWARLEGAVAVVQALKYAASRPVSATQEQAIAWKTTHKSVFVPITQVPAIAEEWRKAGFDVVDLFDHAGPCQQNADAKRLWKTLQEVRNDFEREANRPKGQEAIVDTLWHGPCETLLDFIDNELEATKHLTHPYAAKAQPDQQSNLEA